jgi:hypothetical protein
MSFFCLLWMPFFYLLWTAVSPRTKRDSGGICALLLGSIVALTLFFVGDFINQPGSFGFQRWLNICVDMVTGPALAPFVVFTVLLPFRISHDVTGFALLWLIPDMAIRTLTWSANSDPALLIAMPLLRTSVVLGVSSCLRLIAYKKVLSIICGVILLPVIPTAAVTSYWYFFCQNPTPAFMLLGFTMLWSMVYLIIATARGKEAPRPFPQP